MKKRIGNFFSPLIIWVYLTAMVWQRKCTIGVAQSGLRLTHLHFNFILTEQISPPLPLAADIINWVFSQNSGGSHISTSWQAAMDKNFGCYFNCTCNSQISTRKGSLYCGFPLTMLVSFFCFPIHWLTLEMKNSPKFPTPVKTHHDFF